MDEYARHLELDRGYSAHTVAAYRSDLTALIEEHQPALWVHGHTHVASDVIVDATRVLSVAIGYPPDYERRPRGDPRAGLLEW